MKLFKRIIALSLVVCCLVSLCSCKALDNAKASQAFYTDETMTRIKLGENYYDVIDTGDYGLSVDFIHSGNVTESDVPVLLAEMFGYNFCYDEDKKFIYVDYTSSYYCREDLYDEISKKLINPDLSTFYYYTSYYDDVTEQVINENVIIDAEAFTAAVEAAQLYGEGVSRKLKDNNYYNCSSTAVYCSTEDMLVSLYYCSVDVYTDGEDYFYVLSGNSQIEDGIIIPQKFNEIFDRLQYDIGFEYAIE